MFRTLARLLPPLGWVILTAALTLTLLGVLSIYAGEAAPDARPEKTMRQLAFLAAGLGGFVFMHLLGYRRLVDWAYPLLALILILLALLIIAQKVPMAPLIVPRREAYRWLAIGPVSIQVSECAKLAHILAMAAYLRYRTNFRTFRGLLMPFALTLIPTALILKEPDLGTSILLLPTLFVMLYAAGAKGRHLLIIILLGAAAAPAFYYSPFMHDYQRRRVQALFRQTEADQRWRLNEGYQLNQSKIALGSGRWFGQGYHGGAFFRFNLLPEEHNDFIFAVLGHQWGFLGCLVILLCYLLIIVISFTIASMTTDPFGRLIAVGIAALLSVQTLINISMTMGLAPVTGMSLPFVSMGGSGLVINYLAIGLVSDVARRRPISIAPRPFEFEEEEEEGSG